MSGKFENSDDAAQQAENMSTAPAVTAKVSVKVPPFWKEKPKLWFCQLEAQFLLNGITSDTTKYYTLIGNLDLNIIEKVEEIVDNPPATGKYELLKAEIIKRLSASQQQKIMQLLSHEELGDRKPSAFLRHLQDLAGPGMPNDFLRTIWTSRLPVYLQTIVAQQSERPLEAVAELVDRVAEIVPGNPAVAQVTSATSSSASNLTELIRQEVRNEVSALSQQLKGLSVKLDRTQARRKNTRTHCHSRQPGRSRSRSRNRSYRVDGNRRLCWYHFHFRGKADRCISPCDYASENLKTSR